MSGQEIGQEIHVVDVPEVEVVELVPADITEVPPAEIEKVPTPNAKIALTKQEMIVHFIRSEGLEEYVKSLFKRNKLEKMPPVSKIHFLNSFWFRE